MKRLISAMLAALLIVSAAALWLIRGLMGHGFPQDGLWLLVLVGLLWILGVVISLAGDRPAAVEQEQVGHPACPTERCACGTLG